jgi:hypothetical protein
VDNHSALRLSRVCEYISLWIPTEALLLTRVFLAEESLALLGEPIIAIQVVNLYEVLWLGLGVIFTYRSDEGAVVVEAHCHDARVIVADCLDLREVCHVPHTDEGVRASCHEKSVAIVDDDIIAVPMMAILHLMKGLIRKSLSIEDADSSRLVPNQKEPSISLVP